MARLHRNNAAEWVMVIALTPVAWIIRGWDRFRTNTREPSGSAAGTPVAKKSPPRPVMIEGLPPRTMN